MKDSGNIVYILFLLISLIGWVLKNWKKQQQQPAPQRENRPTIFDFEEIKRAVENRQATEREDQQKLRMMEQEAVLARQRTPEKHKPMKLTRPTTPAMEAAPTHAYIDLKQIDLRKAVIYSEILNPPYL